jgi:hypothetical protein
MVRIAQACLLLVVVAFLPSCRRDSEPSARLCPSRPEIATNVQKIDGDSPRPGLLSSRFCLLQTTPLRYVSR